VRTQSIMITTFTRKRNDEIKIDKTLAIRKLRENNTITEPPIVLAFPIFGRLHETVLTASKGKIGNQ